MHAGPASPSYFAFFSTQKDAAFAAQTRVHPEDSHSFRVMEAPGPEEVCPFLFYTVLRPDLEPTFSHV